MSFIKNGAVSLSDRHRKRGGRVCWGLIEFVEWLQGYKRRVVEQTDAENIAGIPGIPPGCQI